MGHETAPSRGNFRVASVESSYLVCPEGDEGPSAQACSVDPSTCIMGNATSTSSPVSHSHASSERRCAGDTGDGDDVEMLGGRTSRHVGFLISVLTPPPLAYDPLGLAGF